MEPCETDTHGWHDAERARYAVTILTDQPVGSTNALVGALRTESSSGAPVRSRDDITEELRPSTT